MEKHDNRLESDDRSSDEKAVGGDIHDPATEYDLPQDPDASRSEAERAHLVSSHLLIPIAIFTLLTSRNRIAACYGS
jgi:hypothetical protein